MVGVQNPMDGVVYPPEQILQDYRDKGCLGDACLGDALANTLSKFGDSIAIAGPEGSKTYAQVDDESNRFAAALLKMGLKPLDRVIFQVVNSAELMVAMAACWKADLIPVCTLAAHREKEISFLAELANAKAHFIGTDGKQDMLAFAKDIQAKVASLEHIICVRGASDADLSMAAMIAQTSSEDAAQRLAQIKRDPYQVCAFQLSGGTTNVPKIIPRFGNEYLYNIEATADTLTYTSEDRVFIPLQIIHNAGTLMLFSVLLRGGQVLISPSIEPPVMLSVLMQHKPTVFAATPAALSRMKQFNIREMVDLSQLRMVISGNAARQTDAVLGVPGIHIFGMTEGTIMFGLPSFPDEARHTTVGQPISQWDEVRIVRPETEDDVTPGEVGEFLARGPYTFHGYYKSPERNAEVFTNDGFYRSGDLMSAREIEGQTYYAFEGRLKDVVSRGHEKINCEEVEMVARKHPKVGDIAIVAMPDPELDERACAFIVPAGPEGAPTVEELLEFITGEGLAKYKCPERIEAIADFPMTDSGKLSKPKLKAMITNKLENEKAA